MGKQEVEFMQRGVKLLGKMVVAAAEDDEIKSVALFRDAEPDVICAALMTATKLIADEIPLVLVAQLMATAEDYAEDE